MMLCMLVAGGNVWAQSAPSAPDHPWDSTVVKQPFKLPPQSGPAVAMDPAKLYTLPELIDIAEHNNPDTRVAWENAKARAGDLGISKATLYPTMAAAVLAGTARVGVFFGPYFVRQTVEDYRRSSFSITPSSTCSARRRSRSAGTICWRPIFNLMTPTAASSFR